jgi:Protein of unknown function, DUF547
MRSHRHTTILSSRRNALVGLSAVLALSACGSRGKSDAGWLQSSESAATIDHSVWDRLLKAYVKPASDGINRVDYLGLKNSAAAELTAYLTAMQRIDVSAFNRNEQFAYWVNLYNAATIDLIVREYPLETIRDLGLLGQGPWKDEILSVSGKKLSLDDIEHGILRPIWKDVRIHYAVNCASLGCPNLATQAWRADRLEEMLETAAASYVNHPRGFSKVDGKLTASSIFDWYEDDWGSAAKVLEHARKYATGATQTLLAGATTIDSYDYDWSLNASV